MFSDHLAQNQIDAIVHGHCRDPFAILGMHKQEEGLVVNTFLPQASSVAVRDRKTNKLVATLEKVREQGFFSGTMGRRKNPFTYILEVTQGDQVKLMEDPYRFGSLLSPEDLQKFKDGQHWDTYTMMGAHLCEVGDVAGVRFVVWAPNAQRVSIVGEFNNNDGRRHVMRFHPEQGLWELFLPGLEKGTAYMYEIKDQFGTLLPLKADPYAFSAQCPPKRASRVAQIDRYRWKDASWLEYRADHNYYQQPLSIYEVHLGSWRRQSEYGDRYLSYTELAESLIPYVLEMGFTHIELLPISEYPFYGSWGYQPLGLYAPTRRYGNPTEFKRFIDACHQAGIGVILDWVPAHFPADDHGMARFDGTCIYEHEDPRKGFHPDWKTLIYNYDRIEVANFLISNALFWLKEYHIDGLRVDAVASMIYLNYSRDEGEWIPNEDGSNVNRGAIALLKKLNEEVHKIPGAITIAEESTTWPGVTHDLEHGGLGFDFKWNMGWMNDSLAYMKTDPLFRKDHHHKMTFGMSYAYSESFILPLSHDEVVHLKGSLFGRMQGDEWRRFANLRAYYGFMWSHPGKKLLFMGGELAQESEWNHESQLDWNIENNPFRQQITKLIKDLNKLYKDYPALYRQDHHHTGFQWLRADETDISIYAWLRFGDEGDAPLLILCNMTPVPRHDFKFGVPLAGTYKEILSTDHEKYGGSNMTHPRAIPTEPFPLDGQPFSLTVTLAPLATQIFCWKEKPSKKQKATKMKEKPSNKLTAKGKSTSKRK